jgi:hypothetical protein
MANEFVARKGLISSGSINVSGSVTASFFKGDGSQLTNLPSAAVLSSSVSIDTFTFSGDGATQNYILSQSYDVSSLFVSVEGLLQTNIQDYTLTGATLSFINAPPTSSNILVKALMNVTQNITGSFSGSFFGILASSSFATTASFAPTILPEGVVSSSTQVVRVLPSGTVSSSVQINTGSFTGSFTGSAKFNVAPITLVVDNHAFVGNGVITNYTLSSSYDPAVLTVSVEGLLQTQTVDYTLSGTTLSFVTTPPTSSNIFVKAFRLALV